MIWIKRIALVFLTICLGTVIDYIVHHSDPHFSVPPEYFPHKLFYGTLWGLVGYICFKKWLATPLRLAIAISLTPAILLQTMYLIQGHQLVWVVFLFLVLHFFMFLLPGYFICKKYRYLFI